MDELSPRQTLVLVALLLLVLWGVMLVASKNNPNPSIYSQSCYHGVPVEYRCKWFVDNDSWTNWCEKENWFMDYPEDRNLSTHKYMHIGNLQMNLCAMEGGIQLRINPERIDKCEIDDGIEFCYG